MTSKRDMAEALMEGKQVMEDVLDYIESQDDRIAELEKARDWLQDVVNTAKKSLFDAGFDSIPDALKELHRLQSRLAEREQQIVTVLGMQPETHPGWNDEYLKAEWVFETLSAPDDDPNEMTRRVHLIQELLGDEPRVDTSVEDLALLLKDIRTASIGGRQWKGHVMMNPPEEK